MERPAPQPRVSPLRALAILPARLGSTRLPRKMLLDETGTPLIVHSARNAAAARSLERVLVATDSEEIRAAVEAAGLQACMTRADHPSGSDRVQEALETLGEEWEVVLGVQGDEPDVDPADLDALVAAFAAPAVQAATLRVPIEEPAELEDPSAVKVVTDAAGDALYFSRAPIPARGHARPGAPQRPLGWRHVGVYAWRPAALARFCALAPSELEERESLEQLRWLEAGGRMRCLAARHRPRGIDTRRDYEEFVARLGAGTSTSRSVG